jgi:hypothetical protein
MKKSRKLFALISILLMSFALQAQDTIQDNNNGKKKKEKVYNEKGELINETLAKQKLDDLILEYGKTENIAPANFAKKREPFAQAKITICVHKKCTVIKIFY